jgi:hypothetical protein
MCALGFLGFGQEPEEDDRNECRENKGELLRERQRDGQRDEHRRGDGEPAYNPAHCSMAFSDAGDMPPPWMCGQENGCAHSFNVDPLMRM